LVLMKICRKGGDLHVLEKNHFVMNIWAVAHLELRAGKNLMDGEVQPWTGSSHSKKRQRQ